MTRRLAVLPLTAAAGATLAAGAGLAAGAFSSAAHTPRAGQSAQPALVTPFTAWGDHAVYDLVPGGNFRTQAANWSLTGGAQVVTNIADASQSGSRGLSLSSGASATSASFPGGDVHTVRFFAQNQGSSAGMLKVSATVDVNGLMTQVPLGMVSGSSLAPTPVITLPKSLQIDLTRSDAPLRVTLTPVGANSRWLVKDVYVDPMYRCGRNCF